MSNFRHYIDFGNGYERVEPTNNDILFTYTKQEKELFYRKGINTELSFCKDDFSKLFALEESCDRCDQIPFKTEIWCNGVWTVWFEGYLNLNLGAWNPHRCEVKITPQPLDEYNCIIETQGEQKNILNGTTKQTVNNLIGIVDCKNCTDTGINATFLESLIPIATCTPPLDPTFVLVSRQITNATLISSGTYQVTNGTTTSVYCRELVTGTVQPPGSGWVAVTGGYARPLNVDTSYINSTITYQSGAQILKQEFAVSGYNVDTDTSKPPINNGVLLKDVLDLFLSGCGLTIRSNFFGINPDNNYPNNQAYTFALANLQNILLFQKTDITNANAFQNATRASIKFEDLLENLKVLNIGWKIENGVFIIEHISYFQKNLGVDISNELSIKGLIQYSYDNEELPQYERFKWMDRVSFYFEGMDIIYAGACTQLGEEKTYSFDQITTDLDYAIMNPSEIDKDGLFMIAAIEFNGQYYIENSNKALSFTEIHENLWRHDRFQFNGNMNGTDTVFETAKRLKRQVELGVPFDCQKLIAFNPENLIRTQIGDGELSSFEYSTKSCWVTFGISHNQKKC